MFSSKNITKEWLCDKYINQKLTMEKIAKLLNCSTTVIRNDLIKYGIELRSHSESNVIRYNIKISEKWLRQKYILEKLSTIEIAKLKDCAKSTIYELLKRYHIKIRSHSEANIQYIIKKDWLYRKYVIEKLSSYEIAKLSKCSVIVIYNALREHRIKIRSNSEAHKGISKVRIRISKEWLYQRYVMEGLDMPEIAKLIGSRSTHPIRNNLIKYNIKMRSFSEIAKIRHQNNPETHPNRIMEKMAGQ